LQQLSEMTHAAEQYEDEVLGLVSKKKPSTIPEWVRLALFERDMTQAKLAEEIGMPRSKVSEIISGKRRPDLPFLKGLHKVLHADADFLLENA
jgi:antitoxin component HigA of HigAB toxin-antitoxin module